MPTRKKRTATTSAGESLLNNDTDLLQSLMKSALQAVLEGEMLEALGAGPFERCDARQGYRAGYYQRGLVTRIGKPELRIPRDREGWFATELFKRYQSSEKALVSALAASHIQGASTRKVKAIT